MTLTAITSPANSHLASSVRGSCGASKYPLGKPRMVSLSLPFKHLHCPSFHTSRFSSYWYGEYLHESSAHRCKAPSLAVALPVGFAGSCLHGRQRVNV